MTTEIRENKSYYITETLCKWVLERRTIKVSENLIKEIQEWENRWHDYLQSDEWGHRLDNDKANFVRTKQAMHLMGCLIFDNDLPNEPPFNTKEFLDIINKILNI